LIKNQVEDQKRREWFPLTVYGEGNFNITKPYQKNRTMKRGGRALLKNGGGKCRVDSP